MHLFLASTMKIPLRNRCFHILFHQYFKGRVWMSTSFDKEYEWQNIKPDEATKNPINNRYFSEDSVRLTLSSWKLPGWGKTRMAKLMLLTSEWSNCLSILEWLIKIHQWCSLDGLKSLNCLWELCVTVSGFIQSFYHKYWRVRLEVLTFQDCESNSAPDLGKLRKKFFHCEIFFCRIPQESARSIFLVSTPPSALLAGYRYCT